MAQKWLTPYTALVGGLTIATGISLGCLDVVQKEVEKKYATIPENMKYIKQNAPDRYVGMLEEAVELSNKLSDREQAYYFWANNAKSIRDSLRIDSIAKSNYAKGLQMAKDTIKVVN